MIECKYFKLIIFYFMIFSIGMTGFRCSADKEKANEKRAQECRRLLFLEANSLQSPGFTAEESALLQNSEVKFSYSCSNESGGAVSCREFYTKEGENAYLTEICPSGFRKFASECSQQNLVGECRIFQLEYSRWERRIYAMPNDTKDEAKNDCLVSNGRFQDQFGSNLFLPILTACELNQ